jgi:hypothetical protein
VLSDRENRRIDETLKSTGPFDTFFVGPSTLDTTALSVRWPRIDFVAFESSAFESHASYSDWMLRPDLYRRFLAYEFILVAQTDSFLIRPLPVESSWDFDYLGAPWEPPWFKRWDAMEHRIRSAKPYRGRRLRVGNGGLSLRRTMAFARPLDLPVPLVRTYEDIAISFFHRRLGIRLAPVRLARKFFMEKGARSWSPGDPVPAVHGFHALDKFNPALEDHLLG